MYNLVLSGGGIRGILHLGAIKTLNEKNIFKNIKNYAGSSAGSMISLLLSIGYTYNDIMIIFLKINLDKFYDITDIFQFLNIYGLINLDPCEKLLRILLENKFNKKKMSFKELYDLTEKTLHINCINLNSGKEEIFNYINTPNIDIIDACIASSSLPFIFPPKLINNNYYIDAFAVNNCPCNIFKDDLENTICLTIDDFPKNNYEKYKKIEGFQNYIISVFNSFSNYTYDITMNMYKPKIMINLSYNCSPIDFDLPKNILSDIFIKGYTISNEYFINNPIDIPEENNISKETNEKIEEIDNIFDNVEELLETISELSENTNEISENTNEISKNINEISDNI